MMLSKSEIKACLRGDHCAIAPAVFHWYDTDFIKTNMEFVAEMKTKYPDDIVYSFPQFIKRSVEPQLAADEFTDDWGCRFRHAPTGVGAHPTAPIIHTIDEWEEYKEKCIPVVANGFFENAAAEIVCNHPDRYVTMNIWRTFYERMYMLYGMEELWMDIALEEEMFLRLLHDLKEFTLRSIRAAKCSGVDAVYLADDWGMQDRLQISPASWKKFFKPAYADMIDEAHGAGMDVWMHSCGCMDAIVPELIDIGLDVIGNLQTAAVDLKELSARYRGKITFFGGLDVQSNLTQGTPETVAREVEDITKLFEPSKGKFIYTPSNSIMPETPTENVRAMFDAIDKCRRF